MSHFLLADAVEAWVEGLLLLGLLAAIGFLIYRRGIIHRVRRKFRRAERHPYHGDAEDFDRLLRP